MKKILISLFTVFVVAGAAVWGTSAFFSDTETSAANSFVAGAIDLKVDSECTYNGVASDECGTWNETDLTVEKFFNFADVKPGDYGKNTISLRVDNNDAYICATIDGMVDAENGRNEPEAEVDATGDEGELSDELRFFAWADNGNNIWETDEPMLFSNTEGPASDVLDGVVYPLFTPATAALTGEQPAYIGVYWCYGTMTVGDATHTLSCDGSAVTNATQTDSLTANISFYAEQSRHNEGFTCPTLVKTTTGEGWAPLSTQHWVVKARHGGAGGYRAELGLGPGNRVEWNTGGTVPWGKNTPYPFKLEFDSVTQEAKFTIAGNTLTRTMPVPSAGAKLALHSRMDAGYGGMVKVEDVTLDGVSVGSPDEVTATTTGTFLQVSGSNLSDGFVLEGIMTFDWTTSAEERPAMEIHVEY